MQVIRDIVRWDMLERVLLAMMDAGFQLPVFHSTLYRQHWRWVANNIGQFRHDWTRWETNGGDIPIVFNYDFACAYAKEVFDINRELKFVDRWEECMCDYCPVCFGDWNLPCRNGLYNKWLKRNKKGRDEAREFALEIMDMPIITPMIVRAY